MTDRFFARIATAAAGLLLSFGALAAAGGPVEQAGTDIGDRASLQRGAQLYMNYCSGCHALKYLRYSRMADDLGLSEEEVMENLNFTGAAFGEHIISSMPAPKPPISANRMGMVIRATSGDNRLLMIKYMNVMTMPKPRMLSIICGLLAKTGCGGVEGGRVVCPAQLA